MVRVLHVITSLETGGAQAMLARLLESPDAAGVEARVVSLQPGGALRARMEASSQGVEDLGMRRKLPDPRPVLRLARILRAERPDVVQTWLYHADLVGTLATRWTGVGALAWNLRCSYGHAAPRLSARAAPHACARLSRRPAVIVTNSEAGRRSHETIGYRPRRWARIPNGFELERWRPVAGAAADVRAELGLAPSTQLVGLVARPHPVKDHPKALRVAHALAARGLDLALLLVGEGLGPDDPATSELLAAVPGPARVVPLGRREDLPRLLSALDVLVSTSTHEGFPNVLGEALACGTPCVATDAGDSALLVGDAGRTVAVEDESGLVDALAELLLMEPSRRLELGERGRERMRREYALPGIVRRYVSLWEELAAPCAD